MKFFAPRGAG